MITIPLHLADCFDSDSVLASGHSGSPESSSILFSPDPVVASEAGGDYDRAS